MAVKAITGTILTMREAEELSGFIDGMDTWPYEMFLSLDKMGMSVTSIELIDPNLILADGEREVQRIYPGPVGDEIVRHMDMRKEQERIRKCLASRRIRFEVRTPESSDIDAGLHGGYLPLVSLDCGALHQTDGGFEGHMVIVSAVLAGTVEMFDPGPPGHAALQVSREAFGRALHSPSDLAGAVILLRNDDPA